MAKFKWSGMDAYEKKLSALGQGSRAMAKAAVYAAAEIVTDEIRKEIDALQRVSDAESIVAANRRDATFINVSQKNGLRRSLGIAKIRDDDGYINAKVGFAGYNDVKTKKWPGGQPNALIARSCEKGSSAMLRQPFISRAVKKARARAEAEMGRIIDEKIEEIMK